MTRAYQLSSLADLFAFRFRSTWAGALTTLFMLIGVLPMLALQIQAVTDSISILTRDPAQERVAFVFCTLITLFAILFGARHIATRERHEGLVFAIAFESLVKLVMLGSIGLYALYGVFGGPEGLEVWLLQNQTALTTLHTPLAEGPWRTLLLVFFAAAIVMPHMFHMIFTENLNPRALISASWGLPLFLLLMSPGGTADPLGRAAPRRLDHTGVLHHRPRPGGGQPGPGPGRLHRRHLRRQRADHRDDPGALGNGPQPPGAAALPAAGAGQHLPLAEMDPAPADRRHHHGQLRLLPAAGRRTGPLQPGHSVLRRHPAIPSRRPLGAVLADRQPPWLHLRADRRHAGLGDHHAAAPDGERTGPVPAAVRRDLRAGRLQLAPGGAVLAGGQRAGVHPGLAVHRGQRRGKRRRRGLRGGQRTPSATPRTVRRFAAGVRQPAGQAAGRQDRAEGGRAGPARSPPALRRTSPLCPASLARPYRGEPFRADGTQCRPGHRRDLPSLQDQRRKLCHRGHPLHREPPGGLSLPADRPGCRTRHPAPLPPADPARPADGRLLPGQGPGSADVEPRHRGTHRGRRAEGRRFAPVGLARTLEGPAGTFHRRPPTSTCTSSAWSTTATPAG
ncbi:two-component sensor [Pseudomonas aeruginosa]|nr:two-component sensor [Pseudomonas aeruginosa]